MGETKGRQHATICSPKNIMGGSHWVQDSTYISAVYDVHGVGMLFFVGEPFIFDGYAGSCRGPFILNG